jgi:hypothetical protein
MDKPPAVTTSTKLSDAQIETRIKDIEDAIREAKAISAKFEATIATIKHL